MELGAEYLGLSLRSPLVASASPLSQSLNGMRELADAGVGAVVMPSLFAERQQAEQNAVDVELAPDVVAEAGTYFPGYDADGPQARSLDYLRLLEQASSVLEVPVIASLNGATLGGWVQFARRMEDAGAAAVECCIYFVPGDVRMTGAEVEHRYLEIAAAVADAVSVPVAVKLTPYFSSVGHLALRLADTGVAGLVLFNRFFQPEIDTERVALVPGVELSRPADGTLPRTWIAALRRHLPETSLAGSSGVETSDDVVKYLLAGADAVMTTSALLRHGAGYVSELLAGVERWAEGKGYGSVADFRGLLAVPPDAEPNAYQRASYVEAIETWESTD